VCKRSKKNKKKKKKKMLIKLDAGTFFSSSVAEPPAGPASP